LARSNSTAEEKIFRRRKSLLTRIQLRTVVLGVAFAAAVACVPALLFAQTAATASGQTTVSPAQPPRQSPFPPSTPAPTAPSAMPPGVLWNPPAGHPLAAAAPRRNIKASEEKSGVFTTREGLRLRLETEMGNVRVFTDAANEVRYAVRIETDASGPEAQKLTQQFELHATDSPAGANISGNLAGRGQRERVWVTYEIHVPRKYNVEVTTHAGNIQVDDVDGRIILVTQGGNITAGRVTGGVRQAGVLAARLESLGGGHISVRDVGGDLKAVTAGGHITAGNISGDANLSTGGGHIHAGNIHGVAQIDTGGGNISVERAGSRVTASSGGGQISFGEAAGAIQARAAGGGIRVLRVAGPMQLDSNGGSIFLTKVDNAVHASTGTGSITAWLSPSLKIAGASQLESGRGDITVYLPRDLRMTIEATLDTAPGHHITADPSLMMKTTYHTGDSGKQVRGTCEMNGGGEVLKLRAMEGNIQLRYVDEAFMRQQELVQQQVRQEIEMEQQNFQTIVQQSIEDMQKQMNQTWVQNSNRTVIVRPAQPATAQPAMATTPAPGVPMPPAPPPPARTEILWMKLGEFWWGGVRVDPAEQEARRVKEVKAVYPDVARQAGIEGTVSMRVMINKEGAVEKVDVISGEQALQMAAITAVRQWRYQPFLLEGNPVPVVTTVNVKFQIQ
jgi:TonB family protein